MNAAVRFDDTKYHPGEINRNTLASRHNPGTVIKYIAPRVIGPRTPSAFRGGLRSTDWSSVSPNLSVATTTSDLVRGSILPNVKYSNTSVIQSIDGERIINEQRELSRITDILINTILKCCQLQSHNRALELQIEWLESRGQENGSTIEKMYRTEINNAHALISQHSEQKVTLEKKLGATETATSVQDEQYKQLIRNRSAMSKELFDYERQIALNAAEIQFLQRRMKHLDDESQFYLLKNRSLDERKIHIRYQLDEELFAQQTLKMELAVQQGEKISRDDVHLVALEEAQKVIDISQIAGVQPSRVFLDQLNSEVQRMRTEYESKTETYRAEIQRNLELELHRYQVEKSRSDTLSTKDHEVQQEKYQLETREVIKQVSVVRESTSEIRRQIETKEKQLISERDSQESEYQSKRQISLLHQLIKDREQELQQAIQTRNDYKQQIERYKEQMARHSGNKLINDSTKRRSFQQTNQSFLENRISRSSYQELTNDNHTDYRSPSPPRALPQRLSVLQVEEASDEGTLTAYPGFNVDQDCQNLQRLLSYSNVDEVSLIRILCNRSVGQRLQIRERYQTLLHQNLSEALEKISDDNSTKLLRMLLLSPVDRDCFELQRMSTRSQLDETVFVEILFGRSNKHIQLVRDTYRRLFRSSLEDDVLGDRDSQAKRIFLTLLQANRPEDDYVNEDEILHDARDLYEAGTDWKKDESPFVRLLCTRRNAQLKQIFAAYEQFSQMDIEKAIRIYTDENLYRIFMAVVRIIRNRPRYFAYELKKYLKGANTNEDSLNRIMVSRCEVDMVQVKIEYEKIAQRTLYNHIQTDITSNYKRALLELIRQRAESDARLSPTDPSTVQWREPFNRVSSNTSIRRSTDSTVNERVVTEKRESQADDQSMVITFTGPYDNSNQIKKRSLLILNTKPFRPRRGDQNSFRPMPTTHEVPYDFESGDE